MKRFMQYALLCTFMWLSTAVYAQEGVTWKEMHKVQKKETIFGIARDYGLTIEELIKANPEMNTPGYELKKGDFIFIPFSEAEKAQRAQKPQQQPQTTAAPAAPAPKAKDDVRKRAIRVGVMLPLHDVDGDGRRMVEYYRGMLLAIDSLKKRGISVDVNAWNVPIDADIRQTLLEKQAPKCDIIFGPLYTKQMKPLSDFVSHYGIKLVIPFSISGNDVAENPNIYQVYQSPSELNEATIEQYLKRFPTSHTVFIDCNDSTSQKGVFTGGLRKQLDARGIKYNLTNLRSSDDAFAKAFSRTQPNVVVLNTGRSPELNTALAKMNALVARTPGITISLFGYTDWLMYQHVYQDLFFKYDTYIPTTFYRDAQSSKVKRVESLYKKWFGIDVQYALPRFAITGFDQAYFFLEGLHQKGMDFNGTKGESKYMPIQTPLNFKRVGNGGMKNAQRMLIHFTNGRNVTAINY